MRYHVESVLVAAYVNADGPAQPICQALSRVQPQAVTTTFGSACLLVFHRDHRMYEWTRAAPIPIGSTSRDSQR